MSADPYSNCPCGSGKKLKFCCGDILPDLQRVGRLQENQPEAAEKLLREMLARHPQREVLVFELVSLLVELGQYDQSREVLTTFLQHHPDHPRGLVMLSRIALFTDGFAASRRLLHRTFQISSRSLPGEIADLAYLAGLHLLKASDYMAAREHMALSARLTQGDEHHRLLMLLASLEADTNIVLPLRTPHLLMAVSGSEELLQQDLRARKLSLIGCWEPASILYSRMAEAQPESGAIWFNLGLCRAWDGRSTEAAEALHKAAERLTEFDLAAEAESLAQLLDQTQEEHRYSVDSYLFPIRSASDLMERLSRTDVLVRVAESDEDFDEETLAKQGLSLSARFDLLQVPPPDGPIQNRSQLPLTIGEVLLLDIADEAVAARQQLHSPQLQLMTRADEAEDALKRLNEICGDLLLPVPEHMKASARLLTAPRDARIFDVRHYIPDTVSRSQLRSLMSGLDEEMAMQWCSNPLTTLGGKTPLELAGDPAKKYVVAAAIMTAAYNAKLFERTLPSTFLRERLQIPEPKEITLDDSQPCTAISVYMLHRVNISALSNRQLIEFVRRTSMLGLSRLVKASLDVLLQRPEALEKYGPMNAYIARAIIARSENDLPLVTEFMKKSREKAAESRESFRELLELEIRELAMRLDDPEDPEIIEVLHRIRDRYIPKLPEIAGVIQNQLLDAGCGHLVCELELALSAGVSSGELWTPQSESSQGSGRGLWLPGQK